MLTQIDVGSENSFLVPITGATPKDSLLVRKITGLNPPDVTLFMGDYARDGGTYQGRRVGKRNVVITFDLNPNPALGETVAGLREMLYKAFLDPLVDADYVKLTLHDDLGRLRYLVGYVEKFEGEIFDPETIAQISMICPDPYIRDNSETVLTNDPGWTVVPFVYTGTAEAGFKANINITAATPVVTLENNGKKMILTRAFQLGDVIEVDTIRGERALTLTPSGGNPVSIVGNLSPESPWLQIHSQSNTMKVYGSTTNDLVAAVQSLKYTQTYWGV